MTGLLALPSEFPHLVSNPKCTDFGLGMRILNTDAGIVSVADIGSSTETFGYHQSSWVLPTFLSAQGRSNFKNFPDLRRFGSLSAFFGKFGDFADIGGFWRFWKLLGILGLGKPKMRRYVRVHKIVLTSKGPRALGDSGASRPFLEVLADFGGFGDFGRLESSRAFWAW